MFFGWKGVLEHQKHPPKYATALLASNRHQCGVDEQLVMERILDTEASKVCAATKKPLMNRESPYQNYSTNNLQDLPQQCKHLGACLNNERLQQVLSRPHTQVHFTRSISHQPHSITAQSTSTCIPVV